MKSTAKALSFTVLFFFCSNFAFSSDSVDETRAIGSYANGSLVGAMSLPNEETGFLKLFLPRNRGFGTKILQDTLLTLSRKNLDRFPDTERLQIGDLGAEFGGAITGHASHQNGLDADVAYLRINRMEQDPMVTTGFLESFVTQNGVTSNFDSFRNEWLLRTLIGTGLVNRIFVDEMIKRHYCQKLQNDSQSVEFLRRLRPWPNHHHHFHVRLICPSNSPQCIAQDPPPAGNGCDMSRDPEEIGP